VRIWSDEEKVADPATMFVQCNREEHAIQKIIVKALWADMRDEGAQSVMIVTTARVIKGVKGTIKARAYPIQ
jgi:restriction system protein